MINKFQMFKNTKKDHEVNQKDCSAKRKATGELRIPPSGSPA